MASITLTLLTIANFAFHINRFSMLGQARGAQAALRPRPVLHSTNKHCGKRLSLIALLGSLILQHFHSVDPS
jgi:hypothetical protein